MPIRLIELIDEDAEIKKILDALDSGNFIAIDISNEIASVFKNIIRENMFLKGIVLTDLSGLTVAYYSPSYPSKYLEFVLGPSAGVILATAEKTIDGTNNSKVKKVLIEGDNENVYISMVTPNYVLGVLFDTKAPKGLVIRDISLLIKKIREVLKSHGVS